MANEDLNILREQLAGHTGFTNFASASSESSLMGLMFQKMINQVASTERHVDALLSQHTLEGATAVYLDAFAARHGIVRIPAARATDRSTTNVQITASGHTATHVIPAGTSIMATRDGSDVHYETLAAVSCTTGTPTQPAFVQAMSTGPAYNVGSRSLNRIVDESVAYGVTLTVTNLRPISNGRDEEMDDGLRFRIGSKMSGPPGTRLALISFLDASSEVISHRIEELDGEIRLLIQPRDLADLGPTASALYEKIKALVPLGTVVKVRLPVVLKAHVTVNLSVVAEPDQTSASITSAIKAHINRLMIGQSLSVADIRDIAIRFGGPRQTSSIAMSYAVMNVEMTSGGVQRVSGNVRIIGDGMDEPYVITPGWIEVNAS